MQARRRRGFLHDWPLDGRGRAGERWQSVQCVGVKFSQETRLARVKSVHYIPFGRSVGQYSLWASFPDGMATIQGDSAACGLRDK